MRFNLFAAGLLVGAWSALAFPLDSPETVSVCDSEPPQDFREYTKALALTPPSKLKVRQARDEIPPIDVPIWFHVIRKGESQAEGNIPESIIMEQFNYMKNEFAVNASINFQLQGITQHLNVTWYSLTQFFGGDSSAAPAREKADLEMRSTLRKGGYDTLNIYIKGQERGAWGSCKFPELNPNATTRAMDGCNVWHNALRGLATPARMNEGDTVIHEAGHFFGLMHPFQPEISLTSCPCDFSPDADDGIADTVPFCQPQAYHMQCINRDSCPQDGPENRDPIHNFMSYSSDACVYEFTDGQVQRMHEVWHDLRKGK